MKADIVELLTKESDLMFGEIAERLGVDQEDLRGPLRQLVGAGVLKMKEDCVEHDWFYRIRQMDDGPLPDPKEPARLQAERDAYWASPEGQRAEEIWKELTE